MSVNPEANDGFDSVPAFFEEKVREARKAKNVHQAIRIVLGATTVACAVLAPFLGLQIASLASVSLVVAAQSNQRFKEKQTLEENLRLVPIGNADKFVEYLRSQRSRPIVEKRLDAIAGAFRKRAARKLFIASVAIVAMGLSLAGGLIIIPICMGIVTIAEGATAVGTRRERESFLANRWASATTEKLADLADKKDRELGLEEVIQLAKEPQPKEQTQKMASTAKERDGQEGQNGRRASVGIAAPRSAGLRNTGAAQEASATAAIEAAIERGFPNNVAALHDKGKSEAISPTPTETLGAPKRGLRP